MEPALNLANRLLKRTFDIFLSLVGIVSFWWVILLAYIAACIDTRENGFFVQERVGKDGELFNLVKVKTMRSDSNVKTNVTKSSDPRITKLGAFFRKTKIDELPQLFNVLIGNMSFVGPRPDVPGYADELEGRDRKLLSVRPGITGPATLAYRNEEEILEEKENPERYNEEIIFPHKVQLNLGYIEDYSFTDDIQYILATVLSPSILDDSLAVEPIEQVSTEIAFSNGKPAQKFKDNSSIVKHYNPIVTQFIKNLETEKRLGKNWETVVKGDSDDLFWVDEDLFNEFKKRIELDNQEIYS